MKTALLTTLVFLAPAAAMATSLIPHPAPGSLTGKVTVSQPLCVRMPCYPIVTVTGDNGVSVRVSGELLRDVESLAGKEVTVKGIVSGPNDMMVTAVAPGRSHDFVTGTVKNTTVCNKMIPQTCHYSVDIVQLDGSVVKVTDEKFAKGLSELDGALVSIKGNVTNTPCPPGQMCIQLYQPTLWPDAQANIWVRGRLSPAFHTMDAVWPPRERSKYFMEFPNGMSIPVYTNKNYNNLIDRDVWFSGKFDGDKFRVTKSGKPVIPDPIVEPIFPWAVSANDGSNVGIDANTNGGVVAGSPSGAAGAQSAGLQR